MKHQSGDGLDIIEKYDTFGDYIYKKLQEIPREHGILKARAINLIEEQPQLFYTAIRSEQISRLHIADAGLDSIRHMLRRLARHQTDIYVTNKETGKRVKKKGKFLLDQEAHLHASMILVEVGKMLGATIKNKERKSNKR